MSIKLINRTKTREYILKKAQSTRLGWDVRRVSEKALDELEVKFQLMINKCIHAHPTVGKTFKEVL